MFSLNGSPRSTTSCLEAMLGVKPHNALCTPFPEAGKCILDSSLRYSCAKTRRRSETDLKYFFDFRFFFGGIFCLPGNTVREKRKSAERRNNYRLWCSETVLPPSFTEEIRTLEGVSIAENANAKGQRSQQHCSWGALGSSNTAALLLLASVTLLLHCFWLQQHCCFTAFGFSNTVASLLLASATLLLHCFWLQQHCCFTAFGSSNNAAVLLLAPATLLLCCFWLLQHCCFAAFGSSNTVASLLLALATLLLHCFWLQQLLRHCFWLNIVASQVGRL